MHHSKRLAKKQEIKSSLLEYKFTKFQQLQRELVGELQNLEYRLKLFLMKENEGYKIGSREGSDTLLGKRRNN